MAETTRQKAALVTRGPTRNRRGHPGAASRFGRAIALAPARHGWAVGVHYRHSATEAAEVVREIEGAGGRAVALQADLARAAHSHTPIARAAEALGPLACLVNSASLFEM